MGPAPGTAPPHNRESGSLFTKAHANSATGTSTVAAAPGVPPFPISDNRLR